MGLTDWRMEYAKGSSIKKLVPARIKNTTRVPALERLACRPVPALKKCFNRIPPHSVNRRSTLRIMALKAIINRNRNTEIAKA